MSTKPAPDAGDRIHVSVDDLETLPPELQEADPGLRRLVKELRRRVDSSRRNLSDLERTLAGLQRHLRRRYGIVVEGPMDPPATPDPKS